MKETLDWQTGLVLGIVVFCAWRVGLKILSIFRGRGSGGCGSCPGGSAPDGNRKPFDRRS